MNAFQDNGEHPNETKITTFYLKKHINSIKGHCRSCLRSGIKDRKPDTCPCSMSSFDYQY